MSDLSRFTSVTFRNYKALKQYSVSLNDFNVLVGPNNSGKSTIIGAFRILAEGIKKASSRNPEFIDLKVEESWGHRVPLADLPVATENVFTNYDDSQPAVIEFRLSNGNKLDLVFPEQNLCYMVCKTKGRPVRTASDFRREYKISVGFVPILGPVEHDELLYKKEAARLALLTHRASRNFRNIWYHYPEEFDEFRELIRTTWPGMDIEHPVIDRSSNKAILHMFCPEERFPREIFWAGFGFQVWCQMLTYIVRSKNDSILIIDEPDIYLHSDLQRQLVSLLKSLGPDIIISTHSTEIISEADPGDLMVINKKSRSAKRISDPSQLQAIFGVLGSNLNPTLTQLAKSKRAIFVEGKDFQILSTFARCLGKQPVANRSDFAVIPTEGFNPQKIVDFSKGIELTLGGTILKAVIFDRDYRSDDEIKEVHNKLNQFASFSHIHRRKELENYLLIPCVLDRAISRRVEEYNKRNGTDIKFEETSEAILTSLTTPLKSKISGQFISKCSGYEKIKNPGLDQATITQRLLERFEEAWNDTERRLEIIPGKEVLSTLNAYIQDRYKVTLSPTVIIKEMRTGEIPNEIANLIEEIDSFRLQKVQKNDKE
jgi:energy-coupling factor transporter ATP-binding protein EcfA2